MRRVHKLVAIGAVSAALVLPTVACSSSSKSGSETTTTSTTSASSKSFEVTTADGQISLSLDGNLPPGWPTTFPVPDGASPAGSGSLAKGGSGKLVGVFTGSMTPQDAYDFYKSSTAYTVDDSQSLGAGSAYVGTVSFSGTYTGRVTVLSKGGSTTIVIVIDAGSDANTNGTGGSTGTTVVP
ncbi:MAG: hypothetical protein ACXWCM_03145 [Acidimicrobiales bacterium]